MRGWVSECVWVGECTDESLTTSACMSACVREQHYYYRCLRHYRVDDHKHYPVVITLVITIIMTIIITLVITIVITIIITIIMTTIITIIITIFSTGVECVRGPEWQTCTLAEVVRTHVYVRVCV